MTGVYLLFFGFTVAAVTSQILQQQLQQQEDYDYCDEKLKLCEPPTDHTMCRFPAAGLSSRCTPALQEPLTVTEKKRILFWHNKFRSNVANGSEKNKNRKSPTAANMRQLYWDDELERISARWADQCVSSMETVATDKCRNTKRFSVSQNVGTRRVEGSTIDKQAPQMVISWYKEGKNFDPALIDKFLPSDNETATSKQFTNMIWAETFALGCARIIFQEETAGGDKESQKSHVSTVERLVCNYGPGGNEVGKPIYKRGISCAECPEGTECSLAFPGLCALRSSARQENQLNSESQEVKDGTLSKVDPVENNKKGDVGTKGVPMASGTSDESDVDADGNSLYRSETYTDEDGETDESSTSSSSTPADAAEGAGGVKRPQVHANRLIHRIEEIMNSPQSAGAGLLFEGFEKKGTSDGGDNRIINNNYVERVRTNGGKAVGEVKRTIMEVSEGERCKCMEVSVGGGEAIVMKKTAKFIMVAALFLEFFNYRQ